ncbi:tRNA pseudouridine synthase A [Methanocaldococcus vulcanius M7]|uniref:tRNA pseudouridine synthase A n=1 Tax=Methanocaldococcus vulcanius (strain ATCC 700851 / DSM 12094 / M7) TaxID=579137 RepID=C9RHX7_METVM|nr:tRNA pseudouridine(38-40) synthase TruA [Methanocaldococcus vulcanius]ACX73179.1 tRNA pseudouridine synthase A [Methanocaldococcus vulcanius M7]
MYILKIAYDGRYSFQTQPHRNTVCDKVLNTLDEIDLLERRKIIYCGGRTDKGVSALGNFIVVELKKEPSPSYINAKLKNEGIWVLGYREIEKIPEVRYRHYRYILPNMGYDVEAIKRGASILTGTHSFHNLSKKDRTKDRSPIRTIFKIDVSENEFYITLDIFGKSFLWNMVRKMVGALDLVGRGERPVNWIEKLLREDHKEGVPTFPPDGLILVEANVDVDYIYEPYSMKKFKEYWTDLFKLKVMKMGIAKTMMNFDV